MYPVIAVSNVIIGVELQVQVVLIRIELMVRACTVVLLCKSCYLWALLSNLFSLNL